jgi:bifunctional non-homologous end joining protein LigD
LLAHYDPDGRLIYVGRAGTGIDNAELKRLWCRLQALAVATMPLETAAPARARFGAPLVLSRAHCRLARCGRFFDKIKAWNSDPARTSDA